MTRFKCQGFCNTFKNAKRGVILALISENSIKIHYAAAFVALLLAVLLKFSAAKICVVLLTIAMVIITEMINSAIEFALDAVFKNRYSKMVGMAKDISAGAVLAATIIAVAVGVVLYGSAILDLF